MTGQPGPIDTFRPNRNSETVHHTHRHDHGDDRPEPSRSAACRSARAGIAAIVAVVLALLAAPAGASAAPAFDVTLTGGDSEVHDITLRSVTSGQFRLRFGDGGPGVAETPDITLPANFIDPATGSPTFAGATALTAQIAAALNGLSNVTDAGGTVQVTWSNAKSWRVQFNGGLRGVDVPELVAVDGTSPLVGTAPAKISVETIERAVVHRDDRRVDYQINVKNLVANDPPQTTAAVGQTLACDVRTASWLPSIFPELRPTVTAEWFRNGVRIPGQITNSYTVTAADAGTGIQCAALGTNINAAAKFASLPSIVVNPQPATGLPQPPTPASLRPAVSGSGTGMRTCSAPVDWVEDADGDPGTAPTPLPAANFTFKWLRNGQDIPAATSSTYVPVTSGGDPDTGKILQCQVTGTNAGGATIGISNGSAVGTVSQPPSLATTPLLADGWRATVTIELPAGDDTRGDLYDPALTNSGPSGWSCSSAPAVGSAPATVTCRRLDTVDPQQSYPPIGLGILLDPDEPGPVNLTVTATGRGANDPASIADGFAIAPSLPFGLLPGSFWTQLLDQSGAESVQAGAHPWATTAEVAFRSTRRITLPSQTDVGAYTRYVPKAHARVVRTDAPAGLVGNALAPPVLCDDPAKIINRTCPPESLVGEARYRSGGSSWSQKGLVAIEPERGAAAQFAFGDVTTRGIYVLTAELSPEDGYALRVETAPLGQTPFELTSVGASICSYGTNFVTNAAEYVVTGCKKPGDPGAWEKPLLTNPTSCTVEPPMTRMSVESWESPGVFSSLSVEEPSMTGCHRVPFTPSVAMSPTSDTADGASGFDASIDVPVDGFEDPEGISQAHLKKTVVELPEGVSVNPSAATGLAGCSDEQLGLRTDSEPLCPDGSKLGTVTATSPALEETLTGVMVLRTPKSTVPQSGEMLRVALIVRNDARGILVKLPGSATADPGTGRLVATFDDNPQLPIGHVEVHLRGGEKGVLAMPRDCGELSTEVALTPWSRPNSRDVTDTVSKVDQRCGGGFSPKLSAGNSDNTARDLGGTFSFRFSREDGEQWLRGLTAKLPAGLLASVKDLPLCTNAQADAGNCPVESRIGIVDAKAGSGDPFVLEQKGSAYLTEGYKGCAYGLLVNVPVIAGPFRGDMQLSDIKVRQAICVDRRTAQVTAISDPFPTIHHGVPLRVREVTVSVDRPGFMLNPSNCGQKQVEGVFLSDRGATSAISSPFGVVGCSDLPFGPRLSLRLTGRKQVADGKHPGLSAVLRQAPGEAGMKQALTRLPLSLALDPERAQADDLCEFEEARKDDPNCPEASIIGRARAFSPLLNRPLEGPVYFAKNVRFHPRTGNPIRTLPTLVTELSGEIDLVVRATTDTERGKLVTTFPDIPDAPVDRFELNLAGGRDGILVVSGTNLCRRPRGHVTEVDTDGHNGGRRDFDVRMKTPCPDERKSRLRVGKASWSGQKVTVSGRIARAAKGKVRVTVRCGDRTVRGAAPVRRGRWRTTINTAGRCASHDRARIVARYPGRGNLAKANATRTVTIRANSSHSTQTPAWQTALLAVLGLGAERG
jgi:hypothetical protein